MTISTLETSKTIEINGKPCVLGEDGKFLMKTERDTPIGILTVHVPVPEADIIAEFGKKEDRPSTNLIFSNLKKIPFLTMLFVREYFTAVYREHQSEAIILFHWNANLSKYEVVVPPTFNASGGHVSYDPNVRTFCRKCFVGCVEEEPAECPVCGHKEMDTLATVGTAHSHGSMAAFHSGTDDANELNHTGFHITFGKVNSRAFTTAKREGNERKPTDGSFEIMPSFVVALPGTTDAEGKGTRYIPEVSTIVEDPFPEGLERDLISFWTNLLVSEIALASMSSSSLVIVGPGGEALMLEHPRGLQADRVSTTATSLNLGLGLSSTNAVHVLQLSEYRRYLAKTRAIKSLIAGFSQSQAQATDVGVTPEATTLMELPAPGSVTKSTTASAKAGAVVGAKTTIVQGKIPKPSLRGTISSFWLEDSSVVDVDENGEIEIHDGAKTSVKKHSPWYPFMPTNVCKNVLLGPLLVRYWADRLGDILLNDFELFCEKPDEDETLESLVTQNVLELREILDCSFNEEEMQLLSGIEDIFDGTKRTLAEADDIFTNKISAFARCSWFANGLTPYNADATAYLAVLWYFKELIHLAYNDRYMTVPYNAGIEALEEIRNAAFYAANGVYGNLYETYRAIEHQYAART